MATYPTYRPKVCIMIKADMENLNRVKLKEEFSKFGMVTKIFVHPEDSYAKVYYDNIEGVTKACSELNGVNGWNLGIFRDEPRKYNNENSYTQYSNYQSDQSIFPQGVCSSLPETNKEETYVDIYGRDIEVVQDYNDKLYVSLDDVKSAGFHIFSKPDYENCRFPKDMELDQFRQFLLNQGKNYMLTFKKNFSEKDILDVFQRVEEALMDPSKFGNNRQVHAGQSGNFSITASNNVSRFSNKKDKEPNVNRGSGHVPANMRPSASHFNSQPRMTQQNREFRDNRKDMNHTNQNFNNQTRRPRQFNNRSSGNQAPTNNAEEEKWDDTTTVEQPTELPNVNLKPKREAQKSDIVNRLQASPKCSNKVQNGDPKPKVVPSVSQNSVITQAKNIQDNPTPSVLSVTKQETSTAQSKPAEPQTDAAVAKTEEDVWVKYSDLACVKFLTGWSDYVCYSCTGETVSLVPLTDEVIGHLQQLESFVPKDSEPYLVDLMEVCLAKFNDVWCRGLVTDLKDDPNMREILFVDYGNTEDIHVNVIRRFPADLKSIPILSATARFEGIPDKQNVYDRIKELMPDQSLVNVNVLKANADALEYTIKVPSVYDQLTKEGLM